MFFVGSNVLTALISPIVPMEIMSSMPALGVSNFLWLRLAAPQDLHYINGADTLPPPLPPEQERAALDALTRGQPQARDLLITHNLRLVVYIAS